MDIVIFTRVGPQMVYRYIKVITYMWCVYFNIVLHRCVQMYKCNKIYVVYLFYFIITQMMSIAQIKREETMGPFKKPVRVLIVDSRPISDGRIVFTVADCSGAAKAVLYVESMFRLIVSGTGIIITKAKYMNNAIHLGASSQIAKTCPPDISAEITQRARDLLYPPPPPLSTINNVLNMALGETLVTVQGTVTQVCNNLLMYISTPAPVRMNPCSCKYHFLQNRIPSFPKMDK